MPVLPLKKNGPLGGAIGGRSADMGCTCCLKMQSTQYCSACCQSGVSKLDLDWPSQGGWPQLVPSVKRSYPLREPPKPNTWPSLRVNFWATSRNFSIVQDVSAVLTGG